MARLLERARQAAPYNAPILIEGESGTGKELLAAAIHNASRRSGAFVPVNCGAIPRELVESAFFGHKKGAFTGAVSDQSGYFEQANGGTLFLDEVGELPLEAQVKLLRVLQEKKFQRVGERGERTADVRVVAATNRDLLAEVTAVASAGGPGGSAWDVVDIRRRRGPRLPQRYGAVFSHVPRAVHPARLGVYSRRW
jgi:transcriptional regulator with PAS, ATPase and Fis domain